MTISRALLLGAALGLGAGPAGAARPPNAIVILADDLGFSDLGSYGSEIRTPALDRLAAEGVRFTHFYAAPSDSPTRAALLTGLDPQQAGVGYPPELHSNAEAYRGDLAADAQTVAEALRAAGYATYLSGKWQLMRNPEQGPAAASGPLARGFERFYGFLGGEQSYFTPAAWLDGARVAPEAAEPFYATDAISDHAIRFVEEHRTTRPDDPFFLYVAYTAPHWPLQAPAEAVAGHAGVYERGWDALRAARHRRQLGLGILRAEWQLPPRPASVPAWSELEARDWQVRRMQVYAAMVERMDQGIGRLLEALARSGGLEDTALFFLSDNGASAEELGRFTDWWRRLLVHPLPQTTWDGRPIAYGNEPGVLPGPANTCQSVGRGWANLSNTPFRLYKSHLHEGGIAVPLIVRWPAAVRVPPGGLIHAPAHVTDVAATLLELAGLEPAARLHRGQPLRGESLVPLLRGGGRARGPIFWESEGDRAVYDGRWKLVSRWGRPWELYDLEKDRTELHDLATQDRARAAYLAKRWEAWAKRVGVRRWPWTLPFARGLLIAALLLGLAFAVLFVSLARRRQQARRTAAAPAPPASYADPLR